MASALTSCSKFRLERGICHHQLCLSSVRNVKCGTRRSVGSMVVRNVVNSSTKVAEQIKPAVTTSSPNSEPVTYRVTVVIKKQGPGKPWDILRQGDPRPSSIALQLVSTDLDPSTGRGISSEVFSLETSSTSSKDTLKYVATVAVNGQFGTPGAVLVTNKHAVEFFLETIDLESFQAEPVSFCCYSWVHSPSKESTDERPLNRVFFYNAAFLPGFTPPGLQELRDAELKILRGDGKGTRKKWERVYDYDVYNDLGDPDKGNHRPIAGGDAVPYPRRCRTGRHPMKSDPSAESRLSPLDKNYVPRDEDFEQVKAQAFSSGRLRAILQRLVPAIVTHFTETPDEFDSFTDIDRLYFEGVELRDSLDSSGPVVRAVKRLLNLGSSLDNALKFTVPPLLRRDKFGWTRDTEFGRQMLAGLNPLMVRRLQSFPPASTLSEKTYGPLKSALKKEEIEKHLDGISLEQAMDSKKLFILDYHDAFLPLVNQINFLEGRKTYATRTILFLDSGNVFRPVAIELSLPASKAKPNGQKRSFYPENHASGFWFWQAAKAHVSSNHSAYHQVVSHWLQTHAAVEPYVIATNRQLSIMHPVAKLLDPHFRYTMQINATARQTLINGQGVVEKCFTPGMHCLALSAACYKTWRFDKQALPADLLERGMAVEDEQSPNGLKLVFEDYPYAADGLLVWSALKKWVSEYLTIHYKDTDAVSCDCELQAWWEEIKHKGHPDVKEGWPQLTTVDDLTEILTSMIWVASAHHAAVNFGQFLFSGYVPNTPCLTRELVPEEGDANYKLFMSYPQQFMLRLLPNQVQATTVMAVLELLSTHHEDEEYLGERTQKNWTADQQVLEAAERFKAELKNIQDTLDRRNADKRLKHRHGAGIPPYELLMPHSGPGVTARGVPNSVSI